METLRISPQYTSSDWTALDKTDAAHWSKAVAIVRDRLHGRFLDFADKCLKDDYSGFVVLSIARSQQVVVSRNRAGCLLAWETNFARPNSLTSGFAVIHSPSTFRSDKLSELLSMPISPGDRIGPYQIAERIGAGGMGDVYRAADPRMGRDVAIKISAERFSDRFSREVHAVAALNHPNVCTLHDVGANYLVMD
jgi:hypothetical protein